MHVIGIIFIVVLALILIALLKTAGRAGGRDRRPRTGQRRTGPNSYPAPFTGFLDGDTGHNHRGRAGGDHHGHHHGGSAGHHGGGFGGHSGGGHHGG